MNFLVLCYRKICVILLYVSWYFIYKDHNFIVDSWITSWNISVRSSVRSFWTFLDSFCLAREGLAVPLGRCNLLSVMLKLGLAEARDMFFKVFHVYVPHYWSEWWASCHCIAENLTHYFTGTVYGSWKFVTMWMVLHTTGLAKFNPQEDHVICYGLAWGPHFYIHISREGWGRDWIHWYTVIYEQ
jgi:hypothetical protein